MELIIPFRKTDFDSKGNHLKTGKIIFELQKDWEESYHFKFNPLYANVIEGHPLAMQRLTQYHNIDETKDYDFGMEFIDGEIDIDTNLEIEEYSESDTVYAIGSQLILDEDGDGQPIFLVKNENLKEDILVLKYVSDDDEDEENADVPVDVRSGELS